MTTKKLVREINYQDHNELKIHIDIQNNLSLVYQDKKHKQHNIQDL